MAELNSADFMEASAKDDINIKEVINRLIEKIKPKLPEKMQSIRIGQERNPDRICSCWIDSTTFLRSVANASADSVPGRFDSLKTTILPNFLFFDYDVSWSLLLLYIGGTLFYQVHKWRLDLLARFCTRLEILHAVFLSQLLSLDEFDLSPPVYYHGTSSTSTLLPMRILTDLSSDLSRTCSIQYWLILSKLIRSVRSKITKTPSAELK